MRYLHTMLRMRDLDAALDFSVGKLGLRTPPAWGVEWAAPYGVLGT